MSDHTPGPWTWHREETAMQEFRGYSIVGANHLVIILPGCIQNESEADARLIAAAPELLAALETLLDNGDDPHSLSGRDPTVRREDIGPARAAIAKATGVVTQIT